ncbi:MAG: MerR family DNA-binding transcriptional regulator [Pseudomonadota bacterium]
MDQTSHEPREASAPTPDNEPGDRFTITDLASEFGITTRAIRFYELKGLIDPKRERGVRIYTRRDRARLILILRGKRVGYRLEDIRQFLDLYDADPTQRTQMDFLRGRIETSIAELEAKARDIAEVIGELQTMRAEVEARIADLED